MHQDKNRNEILTSTPQPVTLADRRHELSTLPSTEGAFVIESGEKIYQFLRTDDGSPSIRMTDVAQRPETMHHSGGALSESVFIYGDALREVLPVAVPRVLSVGLGCGYNEWIALAEVRRHFAEIPADFYLESFEADDPLRTGFINFLERKPAESELGRHLQNTFGDVLKQVADYYGLPTETLFTDGQKAYANKRWLVRARLDNETIFTQAFGAIFFDAFSTKATPELWNEEFLGRFLAAASAPISVLATYAAVGALNRSLKRAGFELADQPGFQNKRESTRAFRRAKVTPQ